MEIQSTQLVSMEPLIKLGRDLKKAALLLKPSEARYLIDLYYMIQDGRIRSSNQIGSMGENKEPHEVLGWVFSNMQVLERNIKAALDSYSESSEVGQWSKSIYGIGPILAASLMAHIDINIATTAGKIWRFAGLDPSITWLGKEKATKLVNEVIQAADAAGKRDIDEEIVGILAARTSRDAIKLLRAASDPETGKITASSLSKVLAKRPYNQRLKTTCWLIGDSFKKFSARPECYYGKVYRERKALEIQRNEEGKFKDLAEATLREKRIGKTTETYGYYSVGKLPPARLDLRAMRITVKLFLSHWQTVAYESTFKKKAPAPWIIAIGGHQEYVAPPNWVSSY